MFSAWRLVSCLLLTVVLPWQAPAAAEESHDLEPLARGVVFSDPAAGRTPLDVETDRQLRVEIQRSYASLGSVVHARRLHVHRFGLVSVPALVEVLNTSKNVPERWNAALTVAALRDLNGPAYELKLAPAALLKVLRGEGDVHTNAMAALALGCFHAHEAVTPPQPADAKSSDYVALPGVAQRATRSAAALRNARDELARRIEDPLTFMRVAAMFSLAKMGGVEARDAFLGRTIDLSVTPALLRAYLLACAFLGVEDGSICLDALAGRIGGKAADTSQQATAALATAVALLRDERPAWVSGTDDLLRSLRGVAVTQATEQAERVFAQGVFAFVNQSEDTWHDIWRIAITTSTKGMVAAAAAQILAHCPVSSIERDMVRWVVTPPKQLDPAVQALVLLRAGAGGRPAAISALASDWLKNRAKRPAANARWDPRWYAAIGLLRALSHGRIRPQADRRRVLEALQKAVATTLDKEAAIREPLRQLLQVHGAKLVEAEESSLYLLPPAARLRVESSFVCKYGLLARDAIDACVGRVNDAALDTLGLNNIEAWKPGAATNAKKQPERYLKRYLKEFPYFSRLEFFVERGRRPPAVLPEGAQGIDR